MSSQSHLQSIETSLEDAFQPVRPSRAFVDTVRRRIQFVPPIEVSRRMRNRNTMLVILGGVLSALVVFITLARALYYLTGRSVRPSA